MSPQPLRACRVSGSQVRSGRILARPRPGPIILPSRRRPIAQPERLRCETLARSGCHRHYLCAKLSNSPFCAPCRNARHSSGRICSTGPSASLLLRNPTLPFDRSVTSTQFPFAWLNELLVQDEAVAGLIVPDVRRKSYILTPRTRLACWVMGTSRPCRGLEQPAAEIRHGEPRQ